MIRQATESDAEAITRIYNHYVRGTTVTFEERELVAAQLAERMREGFSAGLPWLVIARAERIVGYAYASRWKTRSAYRFTVESTVYLDPVAVGHGMGRRLYDALINELMKAEVHSVVGCIALPNPASVSLHEKCGFKKVAHFTEVGFKFNTWLDVGYWQLLL